MQNDFNEKKICIKIYLKMKKMLPSGYLIYYSYILCSTTMPMKGVKLGKINYDQFSFFGQDYLSIHIRKPTIWVSDHI